jgi:hypothetical protein
MMIDILGLDVYIGFIAFGVSMLCMTALVVAGHIDSKR